MKNVYILPTDKPSRLFIAEKDIDMFILSDKFELGNKLCENQNIYITSDEEIKDGDWFLSLISNRPQIEKEDASFLSKDLYKKITLTTDQDLIKDGVQAIDDEFLEWFVKNPSCEFIEVKYVKTPDGIFYNQDNVPYGYYKIIIPKEEGCSVCKGKKEIEVLVMGTDTEFVECYNCNQKLTKEEPKQETLEEAAMNYLDRTYNLSYERTTWQKLHEKTFIAGAKWQAERMYSEEEVKKMLFHRETHYIKTAHHLHINEWFEQFKKK